MNSVWIYVALAVLAVVVTAVRAAGANQTSKEQQNRREAARQQNDDALKTIETREGLNADLSFSSGCASLSVDRAKGRLTGVSEAVEGGKISLNLSEIESTQVIDLTTSYRHSQEMERLRSGVERHSMYRPYGNHSMREVKDGHAEFEAFKGNMVYGLELKLKKGGTLKVPFFLGDGTVFWQEEERFNQFRKFAEELDQAIRDDAAGRLS
ncbi:MAG: hypothetical protein IKQ80_09325 [Clostridia bacterium]|nr:hypothetical protein [Clostridia bacterium]